MKFLQHINIKYKLIIITMSTVFFSLLMVGSVLIVSEHYNSKQSLIDKLMTVSKIIADRSTAALSFDDENVANEVLSALEYESSVVLSCMYDIDGKLFATYVKDKTIECDLTVQSEKYKSAQHKLKSAMFELSQQVLLDDEKIGEVYVLASLKELNDRLVQYILLVFAMVLFTGVIAYFLAQKQQAAISRPILDLADFARKISTDADYTIRMPLGGKDEMGELNLAFNNMLEQIYKRQIARDEAVKALSEREQDLVVTLNSIGDAVIVTDVNGDVTRMNPVAEHLTGWTFDEAKKLPLKTIFPIVNASTGESIVNPVEKVIATGETVFLSNHTTLIAKDGTERQIADSAAPIRDGENEILGMILVFNDVTEQYLLRESATKSKRDLQAIMDNSPASIHVEDERGHIIFMNKQFSSLFDSASSEIMGKSLHDVLPAVSAENILLNNQRVINTGEILDVVEEVSKDGAWFIYSSVKFPMYDEENKVYAVCSIATDITEKRSQEEQLRRSQKMDALGKLTGGVAHDYNNLLGIIMGYAELLKEHLDKDSKLIKYATDIEHAAERGAKLTKKLLAFTRHKSTDANLLNINQLLQDQQLMLEKTLTVRINLSLNLSEDLWLVWLDGGDLEDAIINMCINASHAMEGSGSLTLRTYNEYLSDVEAQQLHLSEGEYVMLSITDTGQGMNDATREKIFDPFFSTKGEQGTGLGLSQVYGFVKRSGGEIKVYSELGEGTQFVLYFPRSNKIGIQQKVDENKNKKNLKGHENILVVDDETALVGLAQDILAMQGYNVFTAESGVEAVKIMQSEKIDLLVSDVIMPDMDGYHLAEIVQQNHPQIKIQMASGFSDDRHDYMPDSELHQNMLYKPYSASSLLTHVRNLLDKNKAFPDDEIADEEKRLKNTQENVVETKEEQAISSEMESSKKESPKKEVSKKKSGSMRILIMDDDIDICDLFELNLELLGYDTLTASNSDEAIDLYKKYMEKGAPIDAMIVDVNIPGSLGGEAVSKIILDMNSEAKIIVCSGDGGSSLMLNYEQYGFVGALEKTFNREKIKSLLDHILL